MLIIPVIKQLASFLRNILRAIWVFFPAILFLILTLVAFWHFSQGKDLMVLVSWYAARTVANAKKDCKYSAPGYLHEGYYKHMPRFIGFSIFTIIILAFIQTPLFGDGIEEDKKIYFFLLAASIPYYFLLNNYFEKRFKVLRLNRLFLITLLIIITGAALITWNIRQYSWLVIVMLLIL